MSSYEVGRERFYTQVMMVAFVLIVMSAFYEGFRMPSLWSINYFQPGLQDGFYRRSFFGTLLGVSGKLRFNYGFISLIQISILLAIIYFLYKAFMRNTLCALTIGLYLCSPAGSYLFHEVGYVEQAIFLTLILVVWLARIAPVAASIILASTVLMHELSIFFAVPIATAYYFHSEFNWKKSIAFCAPSVSVFLCIYLWGQSVDENHMSEFVRSFEGAGYNYRQDYYEVFSEAFTGDRMDMYYNRHHIFMFAAVLSIAMTSVHLLRFLVLPDNKCLFRVAILGVGLAPLILGGFGWDADRWFFISISSITAQVVFYGFHEQNTVPFKAALPFFLLYVLLVAKLPFTYFDGYSPRPNTVEGVKQFMQLGFFQELEKRGK